MDRASFRGRSRVSAWPHFTIADAKGSVEDRRFPSEGFDHDAATREILAIGTTLLKGARVTGFGHRVVHGGVNYDRPVRITPDVLDDLMKSRRWRRFTNRTISLPFAPIRTILNRAPEIPQFACFDTAFHRSQPYLAQAFALPRRFADAGVRRYGFHGLSYQFLVSRLRELAPELARGRVVFAHLGNGASLCARIRPPRPPRPFPRARRRRAPEMAPRQRLPAFGMPAPLPSSGRMERPPWSPNADPPFRLALGRKRPGEGVRAAPLLSRTSK